MMLVIEVLFNNLIANVSLVCVPTTQTIIKMRPLNSRQIISYIIYQNCKIRRHLPLNCF